jgi:hypothetical protein
MNLKVILSDIKMRVGVSEPSYENKSWGVAALIP